MDPVWSHPVISSLLTRGTMNPIIQVKLAVDTSDRSAIQVAVFIHESPVVPVTCVPMPPDNVFLAFESRTRNTTVTIHGVSARPCGPTVAVAGEHGTIETASGKQEADESASPGPLEERSHSDHSRLMAQAQLLWAVALVVEAGEPMLQGFATRGLSESGLQGPQAVDATLAELVKMVNPSAVRVPLSTGQSLLGHTLEHGLERTLRVLLSRPTQSLFSRAAHGTSVLEQLQRDHLPMLEQLVTSMLNEKRESSDPVARQCREWLSEHLGVGPDQWPSFAAEELFANSSPTVKQLWGSLLDRMDAGTVSALTDDKLKQLERADPCGSLATSLAFLIPGKAQPSYALDALKQARAKCLSAEVPLPVDMVLVAAHYHRETGDQAIAHGLFELWGLLVLKQRPKATLSARLPLGRLLTVRRPCLVLFHSLMGDKIVKVSSHRSLHILSFLAKGGDCCCYCRHARGRQDPWRSA